MVKASEIFEPVELSQVKRLIDAVNGTLTKVTDPDGRVIFESEDSYERYKKANLR